MSGDYKKVTEEEGEVWDILNKDFMPPFRTGYLRVGPEKVFLTEYYLEFADKIKNLEVREDDVWVASYPKTGTTWVQEMVWCINNDLDYERAQQFLPARFPFLEFTSLFDFTRDPIEWPPFLKDSVKYVMEQKSPRFIKTHLPWSLLPQTIQDGTKQPKIVYVCRNAKDTCVSYFHHCRLTEGYKGNLDDFCKLFLSDALCFSPFWSHLLGYWERRDQPNVLFLKYEDMKKDLPGIIKRTAEFLGKSLSDEQVASLQDHLSFESMKNNKAVNYDQVMNPENDESKGHFMRGGRVGDGEKKLKKEVVEEMDKLTEKHLRGTGLVF